VKFIFDELEFVEALEPHMDKSQKRTKKDDASMQRFELSLNEMVRLFTREALLIRLPIL
jgi:hypothetical protein